MPRQKLGLPRATSYRVNALGGLSLLGGHKAVDTSVVAEIQDGIGPRLTLVFDREGWSPALFAELRRRGIAVISWGKGEQAERLPVQEFQPAAITTHPNLSLEQVAGLLRSRWT